SVAALAADGMMEIRAAVPPSPDTIRSARWRMGSSSITCREAEASALTRLPPATLEMSDFRRLSAVFPSHFLLRRAADVRHMSPSGRSPRGPYTRRDDDGDTGARPGGGDGGRPRRADRGPRAH